MVVTGTQNLVQHYPNTAIPNPLNRPLQKLESYNLLFYEKHRVQVMDPHSRGHTLDTGLTIAGMMLSNPNLGSRHF